MFSGHMLCSTNRLKPKNLHFTIVIERKTANTDWFEMLKQLDYVTFLPRNLKTYLLYYKVVIRMILLQMLKLWVLMCTVDACIHVPVGSICVCVDVCVYGWQRKYMEINASSCSLYTSNAALLLVPQRSDRPHARGSKANETAIAQTHPADPWILIRLRREMDAGCLQSQADKLKRGRGRNSMLEELWGLKHR